MNEDIKDKEIEQLALPIIEIIIKGLEENNYDLYTKDFDETMLKAVTKSNFDDTREKIYGQVGKLTNITYLGHLRQSGFTRVLWKGNFEKIKDDVLIELILTINGDQTTVSGLWFK